MVKPHRHVYFHVKLETDLADKLSQQAHDRGITTEQLIKELVDKGLLYLQMAGREFKTSDQSE